MPTVRVLNDVGKFGRPWNSEGQQSNSLMVVVVAVALTAGDAELLLAKKRLISPAGFGDYGVPHASPVPTWLGKSN
jgi:hypothetical protein